MSFLALIRAEPRAMAFGFLCTLASSPGQTFAIALFLPGLKSAFGLNDAQIANLYAAVTVLSAGVLWRVGRWIDHQDLLKYVLTAAGLLALACLLISAAESLALLAAGLFCLRLSGQGLMTHVAATAVARYFTTARGKALSITSLGFSVGEAALPAGLVALMALWGWRPTLAVTGVLALSVVALAVALVRSKADFRAPRRAGSESSGPGGLQWPAKPASGAKNYLFMTGPLWVAQPLVVTALVFHQGVLAEEKGIPIQAVAVTFAAFAVAKVISGLLAGPAIDRFGARALFPLHLMPLCMAVALLLPAATIWTLPVYWLLIGVTSGIAATLHVAILAEIFPPDRLGAARSLFASVAILSSALGPAIYGVLFSLGIAMSSILQGTLIAMICAAVLGVYANFRQR